jgi:hypothetical protein
MSAKVKPVIPPEWIAELEEVLRDPYAPPDQAEMAKACKEMDRMREDLRKKVGELDVAVDLIRDARK